MASIKWVLFIVISAAFTAQARAWFAQCGVRSYKNCYGVLKYCPSSCPESCYVNCRRCKAKCYNENSHASPSGASSSAAPPAEVVLSSMCDKPGAVCHDPRFIGGDGRKFYFHGKVDRDYCLLSDQNLHINAHFMGKAVNQEQDPVGISKTKSELTWVKSIGVLFGYHEIYLGTKKVSKWESGKEQMMVIIDGETLLLPPHKDAHWEDRLRKLKVTRLLNVNAVAVQVIDMFNLTAWIVPLTTEESRVYGFEITEEDCFAHLHLSFNFFGLGPQVTGVLGQTYSSGFKSPLEVDGVMEGDDKFTVSHLFATDCEVATFDKESYSARLAYEVPQGLINQ